MAYTLLLRITGPMQSWGSSAKFNYRATDNFPTKSGIIGMIACALGRGRQDDISDLCSLKFGVRVDSPGTIEGDFQTAHTCDGKEVHLTTREYLANALFLVGLESEDVELLESISYAITNNTWAIFAGRKSYPCTGDISLGVKEKDLVQALCDTPWLATDYQKSTMTNDTQDGCGALRLFVDADDGDAVKDMPKSFNRHHRAFGYRLRKDCGCVRAKSSSRKAYEASNHDCFNLL